MAKKLRIIALVVLVVVCCLMFGSCEFEYGNPDRLNIGPASPAQRISIGLQVALLGVGFVFLVLVILIAMVTAMKYFFIGMNKLNKTLQDKKNAKAIAAPKDVVLLDAPVLGDANENDEEVIAAITAALMAYYDAEQKVVYESNVKFKVRSIREIK